jgi:hypothetical protein
MKKTKEPISEKKYPDPLFNHGTLLITKPIQELVKIKRAKNEFITVLKQPAKIRSILVRGSYDTVTHKIYEGDEHIYFLEYVPCGIGENDLMEFKG